MQTVSYIGYKKNVGFVPIPSPDPISTGINVAQLVIEAGIAIAPFVAKWASSAFARPARDAKDFIANAKGTIINATPEERLAKVIAYSQKINPKAIDVNTREWLKWYKQNYVRDYMNISADAKIYWNNYLNSIRNTYGNVNRIFEDLDAAAFTQSEIDYNATPIQSITNLFTSTGTGSINYVKYGAIGIGLFLLIKYLK